jgi:hypothetical protein
MTSSKFSKWQERLNQIAQDIFELNELRFINLEVVRIVNSNQALLQEPNRFWTFLASCYSTTIIIFLRRQIKIENNINSLGLATLLHDISLNLSEFNREAHVSLYNDKEQANRNFDNFIGCGEKQMTASIIKTDLGRLFKLGDIIEGFADRRVAHRDMRNPGNIPTFNETDACIDEINDIFKKYRILLQGIIDDNLIPETNGNEEWTSIFRIPWMT